MDGSVGTAADALGCQRHLFRMPRDIAYLNAAAYGPLPHAVEEAGIAGVAVKGVPWTLDRDASAARDERARRAAAALIGAGADDMAIVGSVSHAIATAGRNLPLAPGARILRVAGEHSSQALEWSRLAAERGAVEDVVARPKDGDWTRAVLDAVDRPGPPLGIAALTPLHWTDGARIDLDRIAPAVRRQGAALVVDATQAAGAMPIDVARLQPDFLAFPTYKWVLGPYNLAFLYAAPHRQDGQPLEQNGFNRRTAETGSPPTAGARRYDMGERSNPVGIPMAIAGMELVANWTPSRLARRLGTLTARLADGLQESGLPVLPPEQRVPHILGVRVPGGLAEGAIAALAARQVFVSDRAGALRISPHAYNDEDDVDRCVAAVRTVLRRAQ